MDSLGIIDCELFSQAQIDVHQRWNRSEVDVTDQSFRQLILVTRAAEVSRLLTARGLRIGSLNSLSESFALAMSERGSGISIDGKRHLRFKAVFRRLPLIVSAG